MNKVLTDEISEPTSSHIPCPAVARPGRATPSFSHSARLLPAAVRRTETAETAETAEDRLLTLLETHSQSEEFRLRNHCNSQRNTPTTIKRSADLAPKRDWPCQGTFAKSQEWLPSSQREDIAPLFLLAQLIRGNHTDYSRISGKLKSGSETITFLRDVNNTRDRISRSRLVQIGPKGENNNNKIG